MSVLRKMLAVRLVRKARLTIRLAKADAYFHSFEWESYDPSTVNARQRRDLRAIADAYLDLIAEEDMQGCSEALYQCYPWYQVSLIEFVSGRVFQSGSMLQILVSRIQCLLAELKEYSDGDEEEEIYLLNKLLEDSLILRARVKKTILIDCAGTAFTK